MQEWYFTCNKYNYCFLCDINIPRQDVIAFIENCWETGIIGTQINGIDIEFLNPLVEMKSLALAA